MLQLEDDKNLVEKVLNGDIDSFSVLVYKHQERLLRFLMGLTFNRQDAEEILQDSFIRAYNYLHGYNSRWSFSSWIHKISINTFKDFYRRKQRNNFVDYCDDLSNLCFDSGDSIELAYESKEMYSEVVQLINKLKDDLRIALILKSAQGFTYDEIGKIMGISTVNAKVRVSRARNAVAEGLKRNGRCFL